MKINKDIVDTIINSPNGPIIILKERKRYYSPKKKKIKANKYYKALKNSK